MKLTMADKKVSFENIAILAHPDLEAAGVESISIKKFLNGLDVQAISGSLYDEGIRYRIQNGECDLVITLGGDGTVLRAGHLCAPCDIPILAINLGSFGFLIEVSQDSWQESLRQLLDGDYWFEKRMMLNAQLYREEKLVGEWDVLNEVVIGRGHQMRPVHFSTSLDDRPLADYVADALIVSTPTGSTAYALAAGGPVLPPELRNILLLPVAPHLSMDRSVVMAEGANLSVTVISEYDAVLSADGQNSVDLQMNDMVKVCASDHTLRFVRFQDPAYFYRNLVALMDQNPSIRVNT